jgi:hypothetical protein
MDPPQTFDVFKKWIANQPSTELTQADKELIVNIVQ